MPLFRTPPATQNLSFHSLLSQLIYHPRQRLTLFENLSLDQQLKTLKKLPLPIQAQLLNSLSKAQVLALLEYADPDDATDFLRRFPNKKQQEFLKEVNQSLQNDLAILLQFDPQTAAGLMSLNYIQVDQEQTMAELAKVIKKHEKRTGKFPLILVMANEQLVGYLPNYKLAYATASEQVEKYCRPISTIAHSASSKSVIHHFLNHPHSKVAVLNEQGAILGILYSDDVLRAIHQQEGSTLYDFAGVSETETIYDPIQRKVAARYKWLILNLATAFLASFTVSLFNSTIEKYVLLAVYMPIVSGMGGNAATQTLAILVRGIALQQIDLQTALPTLKKELGAGLINGIINGLLVAAIVLLFNHDLRLALILAAAMVLNLLVAAFFGTLVPLIMHKLGKDPAASATIFITTATDVLGFFAFLGLATLALR